MIKYLILEDLGKSFRYIEQARLMDHLEEEEIVGYGEAKRVGVVMP